MSILLVFKEISKVFRIDFSLLSSFHKKFLRKNNLRENEEAAHFYVIIQLQKDSCRHFWLCTNDFFDKSYHYKNLNSLVDSFSFRLKNKTITRNVEMKLAKIEKLYKGELMEYFRCIVKMFRKKENIM